MSDFDYGPVQTYEITWMSGHVEQVPAHQVSWPNNGMALVPAGLMFGAAQESAPALIRMHAQLDGRWLLTLSAREEDIRTIRLVTQPEPIPGGGQP